MHVKVKSKFHCLLWCIRNGIIIPSRYFFSRLGKHKQCVHNYFSYEKFERCGKIYKAEKVIGRPDYYECCGYEFHKSLINFVSVQV